MLWCTRALWGLVSLMGQVPGAKGPRNRTSGQGSRADPTAKSQSQWDGPWLGILSACFQPGHRAVQEPAGGIGHLPGDGNGPRIDPALVQDCPVRAFLGQGLRAPEGRKRGPGPGAGDNAGGSEVSLFLVMI